jgi:hypothetical protein
MSDPEALRLTPRPTSKIRSNRWPPTHRPFGRETADRSGCLPSEPDPCGGPLTTLRGLWLLRTSKVGWGAKPEAAHFKHGLPLSADSGHPQFAMEPRGTTKMGPWRAGVARLGNPSAHLDLKVPLEAHPALNRGRIRARLRSRRREVGRDAPISCDASMIFRWRCSMSP